MTKYQGLNCPFFFCRLLPKLNRKGVVKLNWELMNRVDYSQPRVIKNCLRNYNNLMKLAENGDQVAATICIDLKGAISKKGVLTFKQKRYLQLWLDGFRQIDIATNYRVGQDAVAHKISRAVRNISTFLTKTN